MDGRGTVSGQTGRVRSVRRAATPAAGSAGEIIPNAHIHTRRESTSRAPAIARGRRRSRAHLDGRGHGGHGRHGGHVTYVRNLTRRGVRARARREVHAVVRRALFVNRRQLSTSPGERRAERRLIGSSETRGGERVSPSFVRGNQFDCLPATTCGDVAARRDVAAFFHLRRAPMSPRGCENFDSPSRYLGGSRRARTTRPGATMVHLIARAVENMLPSNDLATRARRGSAAARRTRSIRLTRGEQRGARRPRRQAPRGDLSRAHNPLRHGRFAAMIPGDSAVEQVITSGLFSTLNIYNTLLIGRLILTVRRHGTHPSRTFRAERERDPSPHLSARSLTPKPNAPARFDSSHSGFPTPLASSCTRSPPCATRT